MKTKRLQKRGSAIAAMNPKAPVLTRLLAMRDRDYPYSWYLRHTTATELYHSTDKMALAKKLADTLSINEVRQLLGHSSSKTTKGYVH